MFDLFSNSEEQLKKISEKLKSLEITATSEDGAVFVQLNGEKTVLDIKIDLAKLDLTDSAHLEDLLVTTMNKALNEANSIAEEETNKVISDLLPPGMGGLGNLFGQ